MLKGILIGMVLSFTFFGYILERDFISRDVLLYDIIYLEGRFYKLCEV